MVMRGTNSDLLFCLPKDGVNCVVRWVMKSSRAVGASKVIFRAKEDVPGYGGLMEKCSGCEKAFWHGEIIYVDVAWPVAFCAATIGDCVDNWQTRIGQPAAVHQAENRRFHGNT